MRERLSINLSYLSCFDSSNHLINSSNKIKKTKYIDKQYSNNKIDCSNKTIATYNNSSFNTIANIDNYLYIDQIVAYFNCSESFA